MLQTRKENDGTRKNIPYYFDRFGRFGRSHVSDASGISEDQYRAYFRGRARAYAIEIGDRLLYPAPKNLEEEYGVRPPQSFMYMR